VSGPGLALALTAACIHATWNVLLARTRETQVASAVAIVVGVVAFAPLAAAAWHVQPAAWKYIVTSGFLEFAYWSLLATAYERADLSVVYPVARGVAPVLVLVVGIAFLGAGTSWGQALGVCLVGGGVVLVRGVRSRADRRGALFGLAIAACIASYTLVDKHGIVHANAVAYLEMDLLFPAVGFGAFVLLRRGWPAVRKEIRPPVVLAGIGVFGAYLLVLLALRLASAASVAAVRETSVVLAAGLAYFFLGERVGRVRMAGAVVVVAGVALISLS
jgi:uncharacterized membrane protein